MSSTFLVLMALITCGSINEVPTTAARKPIICVRITIKNDFAVVKNMSGNIAQNFDQLLNHFGCSVNACFFQV